MVVINQENIAIKVVKALRKEGKVALFAGGCVRDRLLGIEPKDYDVATDSDVDETLRILKESGFKTLEIGKAFGVVVGMQDGVSIEIARFRKDADYSDSRRPDSVEFCDIEEDSKRRDFTINAMFYDPIDGEIIDFVGGQADLDLRILRFVGNPEERIAEDPLRMMRFIRFGTSLGFLPDASAGQAILRNGALIKKVSAERIGDEINKGMLHGQSHYYFAAMHNYGLWKHIVPEFTEYTDSPRAEQSPEWHPEGCVGNHVYNMLQDGESLGIIEGNPVLLWGVLLHDVSKMETFKVRDGMITNRGHAEKGVIRGERIMRDLKFSNSISDKVKELIRHHMNWMNVKAMKLSKVKRMLARETIEDEILLHMLDCRNSNGDTSNVDFIRQKQREIPPEVAKPDWLVTGKDLIDLGVKPSKGLGEMLDALHDMQLEGDYATREGGLVAAREMIE